jgi:hypothetical protein
MLRWCCFSLLQMEEMVAKTEATAIPASECVSIIVQAATAPTAQVGWAVVVPLAILACMSQAVCQNLVLDLCRAAPSVRAIAGSVRLDCAPSPPPPPPAFCS